MADNSRTALVEPSTPVQQVRIGNNFAPNGLVEGLCRVLAAVTGVVALP